MKTFWKILTGFFAGVLTVILLTKKDSKQKGKSFKEKKIDKKVFDNHSRSELIKFIKRKCSRGT